MELQSEGRPGRIVESEEIGCMNDAFSGKLRGNIFDDDRLNATITFTRRIAGAVEKMCVRSIKAKEEYRLNSYPSCSVKYESLT